MQKLFKLTERQESTDAAGRLQRPWTVLLFGLLASVAIVAVVLVRASGRNQPITDPAMLGLFAFAGAALVLSAAYAYFGSRHSLKLARRVVGTIGGLVILGGVAVLVYSMSTMLP